MAKTQTKLGIIRMTTTALPASKVAKRVRCKPTYLYRIEAGFDEPSVDLMERLAKLYGVPGMGLWEAWFETAISYHETQVLELKRRSAA